MLEITAFISSSPESAMPSTLAPDRLGASSRRVLSRETRPPGSGEVSLSQECHTIGLLRPHVLVGYQWSHTGLCPGCRPVITATSAASCRTPSFSGHRYPARRAASTADPNDCEAWCVEREREVAVGGCSGRLCHGSLLLLHCSGARKALEVGPVFGYRLWFPSREFMNAVGASCTQTIRKP